MNLTCENEGSNCGDEGGEEGVEGEGADKDGVDELDDGSEHNVEQVGINDLQLGAERAVRLGKLLHDIADGRGAGLWSKCGVSRWWCAASIE